jgi:hypothetical protein
MERRSAKSLSAFLAGLQAGMVGVWWMLAWMGASAVWQRQSFWTAENLMASVFYGNAAIRWGFSAGSLLGAGFAMAVAGRLPRSRLPLASMAFALCWYYAAFHLAAKAAWPLVALLDTERTTVLGHLLYGALLARFPAYLPHAAAPPAASALDIVPEARSEAQEQ